MSERLTSLGYQAIGKQTAANVPVTPSVYVPYYKNSLATDIGLNDDAPVYGAKFQNFQNIQGQRNHKGTLEFIAEPNSLARLFDMLMTHVSVSGSGPYTHTYQLTTPDPNFYTYDISTGNQVIRWYGVAASKLSPTWSKDVMHINLSVSALGSFYFRTIASVTPGSPATITLDTSYDPANPTLGLVAADLVGFSHPDGTGQINTTVTAVTNGISFTVPTTPTGIAVGDVVFLRPATSPTLALLPTFTWPLTQYLVGASSAATLLSANTQTRLETGISLDIMHNFNNDAGEGRSGGYDPASLARLQGDFNLKFKQFFDTPAAQVNWQNFVKQSFIQRAYSSGTTYEFRFTANNMRVKGDPISFEAGKLIYHEQEMSGQYDQTDGAGMGVVIVNNLPTI